MVIELSAVRLLAPYFGTALTVWTHVIGVLLLGLALGYVLGARLSAGQQVARRLALVLTLAGLLAACLPTLTHALAGYLLPGDLQLAAAARVLEWGSLATSLCCFLPPALLLGTVSPLVLEVLARRTGSRAGLVGGAVFAASTLGSLVGTFATSYWLLPSLGLTRTYLGCGLVLVAWASLALWGSGFKRQALLPLILMSGFALLPASAGRPLREGLRLLDRADSPYAQVRVVEDSTSGLRFLAVNEHSDSYQSVWAPTPGLLPTGYYYNYFVLPAWWQSASQPGPRDYRVLLLGLGGGSAWRVLSAALPAGLSLSGVGVELDPVVVELSRRHLDLPSPGGPLAVWSGIDARVAAGILERQGQRFELIVLDCYANQMELPEHLGTLEHFLLLRRLLEPNGVLAINVGAFDLEDPVLTSLGTTLAAAFGTKALALGVKNSRNAVLFATPAGIPVEPDGARFLAVPEALRTELATRRVAGLRWFEPAPGVSDDRSGLARAQQRALQRVESQLEQLENAGALR
jgi:spermidine synthase